jgi:integrase
MPLTDFACRNAKPGPKLRKLSDMGGLQLWVYPTGSRLWLFAYRFAGKQKTLSIGPYPRVTLAQARAERERAKDMLAAGQDPSYVKRMEKIEREYPSDGFEAVAKEYLDKLRREGRSDATMTKIEWLIDFALPVLGPKRVSEIRPIEVLAVLRAVERRGRYETARRLRSTIGAVCRYAVATARAEMDPTAALAGALTTPKVTPRAAIIDPKAFGALLRAIDGFDGQPTTRLGLKLMALLFPRPGELRLSEWPEFDLEAGIWVIPAARAKMRRTHRIPLAPQAIAALKELQEVARKGPLLFASVQSNKRPMSENTLNGALRRLGYAKDEMSAHGFRAAASTLLNESGLWHADAIERQLGHVEGNDVRRAYARGEHWDERVKMMAWWADHLDELRRVGEVAAADRKSA